MNRTDRLLHSLPRPYLIAGILVLDLLVLYVDHVTGPQIPFTIFYLALVYFALKYAGSRFAYVFVFLTALGKTYVKALGYAEPLPFLALWQFISTYALYGTLCYLLNAQMTRRKQAEVALDELSKLHQSIIAETDSGVMVFQTDGECILANETGARITGATQEQMQKINYQTTPLWGDAGIQDAAEAALRTGVVQRINTTLRAPDGGVIFCIASLGRIVRENAPPYLLLVFTDISAYREAELALKQANATAENALDRASMAERRIINISEETQQRIGRELHDDLGQHLTGIAFMSEVLHKRLEQKEHPGAKDASRITALINEAISKTRTMAHGLYPVELKEAGLSAMLRTLANNVQSLYQTPCEFTCEEECRISDPLATINLFRIAQEAINNAIKHSGATRISLKIISTAFLTHLEISDNGCGIDRLAEKEGLGMHTMKYRASLLGGTLLILALPGGGTRISVNLTTLQE